jgi:hypothetical protein
MHALAARLRFASHWRRVTLSASPISATVPQVATKSVTHALSAHLGFAHNGRHA